MAAALVAPSATSNHAIHWRVYKEETASMKVSFCIIPDAAVEEILDTIELGDQLGFDAVYIADEIFHQDAWQILAAAAARTEHIELRITTSIVLHQPSYVAQRLLTLDALSNGRAGALYSVGNTSMLAQHGVDLADLRMIGRLREADRILRSMLDHSEVDFDGKYFHYNGIFTSAQARQKRIPLTMAAMTGPKTFELAGEVSDGVMTGLMYSDEALAFGVECVKRGAERAGRDWRCLEVAAGLLGTISHDGEAARGVARVLAAFYIPAMADASARRHGIDPQDLVPIREAFARGDIHEAIRLASAEITDKLVMPVGTPEECVEQLRVLVPLGYNHVAFTPIDNEIVRRLVDVDLPEVPSVKEQLQLIHDEVLPSLRDAGVTAGAQ
jgi:alkanesulfonate monooxygenase SsuD/methylene tetrahydromethanopterin reductase-like flavin-dependent oxidoreductase (luciferase family)